MAKNIYFSDEALTGINKGVRKLADAVRITMGPRGRNVIIDKPYGGPIITNDGVTIAQEIELEDPLENMGAQAVKEAATKTNDVAGDGTTTSTVLADAMIHEGLRNITSGANPVELRQGINKASEATVKFLLAKSQKITQKEDVISVATISAQDNEVGQFIADAMDKVGNNGVITVEEGRKFGLEMAVTIGMQFDQGYISPYFTTDQNTMESVIENAHILITDQKISSAQDLVPLLENLAQAGHKELVIISDDVDGEALTTLVVNKLRGGFKSLAIKAPGFGDQKGQMLEDIAILTGAVVISSAVGLTLKDAKFEHLGNARKVIATKNKTTIIEGAGQKANIAARANTIIQQIETEKSDFNRQKLQERVAKLTGGVAILKVGAATELELKEKKHRIEDALLATRAAVEEGILPGGGIAYLRAISNLDELKKVAKTTDEKIGIEIVAKALSYPIQQIIKNTGQDSAVIINHILQEKDFNMGYNADSKSYENLLKSGVIDPTKVTRSALQNAASVASILLTTDVAVVDIPTDDNSAPAAGMGGMGGGMPMM